jgi:hypothetical protein
MQRVILQMRRKYYRKAYKLNGAIVYHLKRELTMLHHTSQAKTNNATLAQVINSRQL